MRETPWGALLTAVFCLFLAALAFGWQRAVSRTVKTAATPSSWERVREQAPMPREFVQTADVPEAVFQAVVRANPFSPQRRRVPLVTPSASSGTPQAPQVLPAQFVYKGRVLMGRTQRAVLEEVNTKKTSFVEIGQAVEGFTVLDITEIQVILSNPQTHEEVVVPVSSKAKP
jgi:hypothetical protein